MRTFFATLVGFLRGERSCVLCRMMLPRERRHKFHDRFFCDRFCAKAWATNELERMLRETA